MKLSLLANPIFLIGAAIAVLAFLVVKYHKQIWEFITRIWGDIFSFLKRAWGDILSFAKQWWPLIFGAAGLIVKYHQQIWGFIQRIWNTITGFFKNTWNTIWTDAKNAWGTIVGWVGKLPGRILAALGVAATTLYGWGKGVIQGLLNGFSALWKSVSDFFTGLPKKILGWLGIHSPPQWAIDAGKHVMNGLGIGMTQAHSAMSKAAAASIAATVQGALGGNVAGWIRQALKITGMPQSWFAPLARLVGFESGGDPLARNLSPAGIAAGRPEGIAQVTIGTFAASHLAGLNDIWNPVDNLVAGIRHILTAWNGSIFNIPGLGAPGSYGGYAAGGPASGLAMVGERGRELVRLPPGSHVYPHGQSESMLAAGRSPLRIEFVVRSSGQSAFDRFMTSWLKEYVQVNGGGSAEAAFAP